MKEKAFTQWGDRSTQGTITVANRHNAQNPQIELVNLARRAKLGRWEVAQNTACVCSHLNLLCPSPGSPTPDARILESGSRLTKLFQRDTKSPRTPSLALTRFSDNSSEFHRVRVLSVCWKYVRIVRSASYVPCRISNFWWLNPHGRFNSVPGHHISQWVTPFHCLKACAQLRTKLYW